MYDVLWYTYSKLNFKSEKLVVKNTIKINQKLQHKIFAARLLKWCTKFWVSQDMVFNA